MRRLVARTSSLLCQRKASPTPAEGVSVFGLNGRVAKSMCRARLTAPRRGLFSACDGLHENQQLAALKSDKARIKTLYDIQYIQCQSISPVKDLWTRAARAAGDLRESTSIRPTNDSNISQGFHLSLLNLDKSLASA